MVCSVGATTSAWTATNVQPANAGAYTVLVSNLYGTDKSFSAFLTVTGGLNAPQIDSIASLPDGKIGLQISGGPGNFAIEGTPGLSGWTQLCSLTATGILFQYVDPDTNQTSRFYRVRVTP